MERVRATGRGSQKGRKGLTQLKKNLQQGPLGYDCGRCTGRGPLNPISPIEELYRMSMQTDSEILFERFCNETAIPYAPIPPEPEAGRQTPDYELHLQVPPILAEIKQINLNPEDRALSRQLHETGTYAFEDLPGKRVRGKIPEAASQLKARAKPNQPTLLIIYNNVDTLRGFTDPFQVMSAMYGVPEAVLVRNCTPIAYSGRYFTGSGEVGGSRLSTTRPSAPWRCCL